MPQNSTLVLAIRDVERFRGRLIEIGFSPAIASGERVLPAAVGARSRYNAEGEFEIHKDQPRETAYRQVEWHWKEFRGRYERVDRWDIRDVPYQRYPRTFRPPPSVELTIATAPDDSTLVISDRLSNNAASHPMILHTANLFLELFGELETLTEDLDAYLVTELRRLNWTLLPAGEHPWPTMRSHLQPHVDRAPEGNRPVLLHRLEKVNSYGPAFTAVGEGGFTGYIVFGFPDKELYVLESLYYGNATYVFGENWESLSQRTKAEILVGGLEEDRIVHRRGWDAAVGKLLG